MNIMLLPVQSLGSLCPLQGQFHDGAAKGLGLVTFADGSHGHPRCEGQFEGVECVKRCAPGDIVKRARQTAARARAILQ